MSISRVSFTFRSLHIKDNIRQVFGHGFTDYDAIDKIMKFSARYYLFASENLDQYENRQIKKARIWVASLLRLCLFTTWLRYGLSSVVGSRSMTIMMADANYLITNQRLFSMILSLAAFTILFIIVLLLYHEINYDLFLIEFLIDWKAKRLLSLNERNEKRLTLIVDVMTKYVMKKAFWQLVISSSFLLLSKTLEAYMDETSGFMLLPTLFFSVCMLVWMIQYYCTVCVGLVIWTIPIFYFKYKFREIHQLIEWCVAAKNEPLLMKAINQHHNIALKVKGIDNIFKYIVFVLYYVGSPASIMLVFVCQMKETIAIARPIFVFIVVLVLFVVFYLNLISAQISHSASKPKHLLYKYVINNRMPIRIRLRIYNFIEKLSGYDICFHCWNIFQMNSYTFYQYITGCVCTYILINNLYNGLK